MFGDFARMLEWLIIGGGIHGTYLSLYLTRRKNVAPDRVRVLDPFPEPLTLWNHFTRNTGMEYLRSSHAHNMHFDPFSLVTFTRTRAGEPLARFIEPYGRPSLELFQAHTHLLIERYHLNDLRLIGRAARLTRMTTGWCVTTESGEIESRQVILAIGVTEQPLWPDWSQGLRDSGAPIHHIFELDFHRDDLPNWSHLVIVGGGITAAQAAIAFALRTPETVTLLMRHPPRVHQFDADIGWITPQYLEGFHREMDYTRRRAMITEARHRGSMPNDVAEELRVAIQNNVLRLQKGEIIEARHRLPQQTHSTKLTLSNGDTLTADQIILATGFESKRPGGAWLDAAISEYGLPVAPDGYPVVDSSLCWSPGLYVSGPLAELEVGPVARNLVGVRLAAERIGASL